MSSEFLFNHRFVYQEGLDAPKASKTEQIDRRTEVQRSNQEAGTDADKNVAEAQQQASEIMKKFRDSVPDTENLTPEKFKEMAKTHPEMVLGSAEQLKNKEGYKENIETAAREAVKRNPAAAIVLDMGFKNEPYYKEIMATAFNNLTQTDPRMVIGYAVIKYGKSGETNALVKKANEAMVRFNHYKN